MQSFFPGILILPIVVVASACSSSNSSRTNNIPIDDEPVTGILNSENANAIIFQAFDVLSGRAYDWRLTSFPYTQSVEIDDELHYLPRDCQNEGTVEVLQSAPDETFSFDSFYSDCTIGADTLNGRMVYADDTEYSWGYSRTFADNFSVDFQAAGHMDVTRTYAYWPSLSYGRRVEVSNFDYYLSYSGGTLGVRNANTVRSFRMDGSGDVDDNISRMAGSSDMTPPVLDGTTVSVSVVTDFVNETNVSQLAHERGQMLIQAGDSQIILDADNGDFQSAKVTVSSADGSEVDSTEDWSTWHDALAIKPPQLSEQIPMLQLDGDGTLINPENNREVLKEVINVYTGVRFGREILDMLNYPMPEFPERFLSQSAPPMAMASQSLKHVSMTVALF